MDYKKFYFLEDYLFRDVKEKFHTYHKIDALDFFCIIIWKANRAKTIIAKRLINRAVEKFRTDKLDLDTICNEIAREIYSRHDSPKEQLKYLLEEWGFRLPMASSILTVLYPELFSIYDIRVSKTLESFENLNSISDVVEKVGKYFEYVEKLKDKAPTELSLRDKDRFLWGKSFYEDLKQDIERGFKK